MTACAPQIKIVPPKRGLCPEEINRLGATWVQIEAQIGVLCGLTPDIRTFLGWRPFFFFLETTHFRPEKPLEFLISAGKSLANLEKTFSFFFGGHLFTARKSLANLENFILFLEITCKNRLNFRFRPENPFESLFLTLFIWSRLG